MNKNEKREIDDWLKKYGDPEIEKKVATYIKKLTKKINGKNRRKN